MQRYKRPTLSWTAKTRRQALEKEMFDMKDVEAAARAERAMENEEKLRSRASTFTLRAAQRMPEASGDAISTDIYSPSADVRVALRGYQVPFCFSFRVL